MANTLNAISLFFFSKINNKEIAECKECSLKFILSIKGRSCNPTPFVHQDISKKTTFFYLKGDNKLNVRRYYGSCLPYSLSLTSMYVPSLISIPLVLSKIWPG